MAENSAIEWTDHTFNPWVGCTKISPACDHCYAENWAKRTGNAALWSGDRRRTAAATWRQPWKWNGEAARTGRRLRVFCASLADVFDNQAQAEWRHDLFDLIRATPHLDWQLLTKRPQQIARMLPPDWGAGWPHVWLGVTVANQEEADRNIPHLLRVPAAVRFLSCEPMLGPIDLGDWLVATCEDHSRGPGGLGWVIAGGESGPGARPMHPDWVRGLRDQCSATGVPFFFKQHGEFREWDHQPWTEEVDNDSEAADVITASAVRPSWVTPKGEVFTNRSQLPEGVPCRLVERIGKKAAGALLDGREWREMPA